MQYAIQWWAEPCYPGAEPGARYIAQRMLAAKRDEKNAIGCATFSSQYLSLMLFALWPNGILNCFGLPYDCRFQSLWYLKLAVSQIFLADKLTVMTCVRIQRCWPPCQLAFGHSQLPWSQASDLIEHFYLWIGSSYIICKWFYLRFLKPESYRTNNS